MWRDSLLRRVPGVHLQLAWCRLVKIKQDLVQLIYVVLEEMQIRALVDYPE
jgi:hypothetical protein